MSIGISNNFKRFAMLMASLVAVSGLAFLVDITNAATTLQPGEVRVSKTAKAVAGKVNTWDIELTMEARDSNKTSDTVLVIDRSGSMGETGSGGNTKLKNAKDAASTFVDTLLPAGNTTNRIAVVSFAGDVSTNANFTGATGAASLKTTINGLSASGGTYTQTGIHRAQSLIASSTANYKNIVLLSDGEPTYSTSINNLCANTSAWTTSNQTNTSVPSSAYDYSTRVGNGSDGTQGYGWCGFSYYSYNHGNSTIAEAGFAKTAGSTIYTIALSAGATGNNVLNQVATPGNAYTGSASDLQAIFDEIAGKIAAAAKDVSIQDVIAPEFTPIASSASNSGVITGNTANWGTFQLSAPDSDGVRKATRTVRVQLANSFVDNPTQKLFATNTSVAFNYTDADGNIQTRTAASPQVNPVLIHTQKVLNSNKADAGDQFKIAVTDQGNADFGATFAGSGTAISNKPRETGNYTVSESILGSGQYDTTLEYRIGSGNWQSAATFSLANGYQASTDPNNTDNDVYVRATNTAKVGSLVLHKTLGNCTQGVTTTTNGTTFNFEVKNAAGTTVATPSLVVSRDNCHASVSLPSLPQGVYTITETGAADYTTTHSIDGDQTVHTGKVATVTVGLASTLDRTVTFNNRFAVADRSITITKAWQGGLATDHTATFELWRDGAKLAGQDKTIIGNASAAWTVPATDIYGVAYTYTIKEAATPTNYTVSCAGLANGACPVPANGNVYVNNTYTSPKTSFTAQKVWVGGPTPRPTVQFQLYQNDVAHGASVSLANGITSYTWNNLDATDTSGTAYVYTVKEVSAPENYTMSQQGNTITNTYVSPKIDVTANKVWVGGPTERPTVQLQLYRNDVALGTAVNLPSGTTSYTWTNLDKTDEQGSDYTYTVREPTTPPNYTKEERGLTVTNTYVSPKIDITAKKEWVDGPSSRPDVEFQLYRNGATLGSPVTLTQATGFTYTWASLDQTDADGVNYIYSVNEVTVPQDYNATVSRDGLTVTNTYVIPTNGQATASKTWVNGPSPCPTVQFQLYRNIVGSAPVAVPGAEVKSLVDGVTNVTWTGLETTDRSGNAYVFTVREVNAPANYTQSYSDDGLTVTNTYVIPTDGEATATKTWSGGPSPRPTVWFQLYRSIGDTREAVPGADIKELVDGVTNVTWTGLERTNLAGQDYVFSVEEVNAAGAPTVPVNYIATANGLAITNTYVSPKTTFTVEKIWRGGPVVRPAVQIQLYRNGAAYGEPIILTNGVTTYTWTELAKTDEAGNEYVYTVDEPIVPEHYSKYVDGSRITNTYNHTPGRGGATPSTPVTLTSMSAPIVAPAELPRTGASTRGNPLIILLAGFATYIAAYFLQGRRKQDQEA